MSRLSELNTDNILSYILFNQCYVKLKFKKSFTTLKAYRNLYRGHTECFELSKCSKTHPSFTSDSYSQLFRPLFSIPSLRYLHRHSYAKVQWACPDTRYLSCTWYCSTQYRHRERSRIWNQDGYFHRCKACSLCVLVRRNEVCYRSANEISH